MMQTLLKTGVIFLSVSLFMSCQTAMSLKPNEYVYQVTEGKPCYFETLKDLAKNKNVKCVELKDLEGWLLIQPDNLKQFLTRGVDELIVIKNQEKPRQEPIP